MTKIKTQNIIMVQKQEIVIMTEIEIMIGNRNIDIKINIQEEFMF